MSLTKVSYSMILGAPANVFDYMTSAEIALVQAGTPGDNYAAFTAALAASNNIIIPAGSYKTSGTLYFKDHVITGAGSQYSGGQNNGTLITCTADVSCFKYNGAYGYGTKITGIFIDFGPSIPAGGVLRIGIDIPDVAAWPGFYEFSDLRIRGASIGILDAGASFEGKYSMVHTEQCRLGFYKKAGTTVTYTNCFASNGYQAWDVVNCISMVFTNCAFDLNTDPDSVPIFRATNCTGLIINGLDHEGNTVSSNGNSMFKILNCVGYSINGIGTVNCYISPTTGEAYWMRISGNSVGSLSAVNSNSLSYAKVGGGTTVYQVLVDGSAYATFKGCFIGQLIRETTPSAVVGIANTGLGRVNIEVTPVFESLVNVYELIGTKSNVLSATAFNSLAGTTTVVGGVAKTLFGLPLEGTYIVNVYAGYSGTNFMSSSIAINDGSTLTLTPLKAGSGNVLSVSGTDIQVTCAGSTTDTYSCLKIA